MCQLGMFAKYWQPGEVKTRLAADIGDFAATRIYRTFVIALLARLRNVTAGARPVLAYAPRERQHEFAQLADGWKLVPQATGDLGERMRSFFQDAFAGGARRVVLLGSDSPNVPLQYVRQALRRLKDEDLVLGPTPDGGYYLIGARVAVPGIFDGVTWSSPQVWKQTVARVQNARLSFGELPQWYDVDDGKDLSRLMQDLRGATEAELVALRDDIEQVLGGMQRND